MDIGNVLVVGNSGVGKSTLINAVLGEDLAQAGFGLEGTTKRLEIYESKDIPFRIIDTVGFEPSMMKRYRAINSVKKWSKESAKEGKENREINVIWFCVDGTAGKLFDKAIKSFLRATSMWKSVPVVVVITKSYSEPDRIQNIKMVNDAFENQKRKPENIIPIVASTYTINETAFAPPYGITELIDITDIIMPEGKKAATKDLNWFKLKRKRILSHGLVSAATLSGITIGATPIPGVDSILLSGIEIGLINGLAKLYGINKEEAKLFENSLGGVVSISAIAKNIVSTLKAIPGINLGASIIQAIVAGTIVAAIGEGAIYIFEKVSIGEKSISDIDWINKVMNERFSDQFIEKVTAISKLVDKNKENKDNKLFIRELIMDMFVKKTKNSAQ